jgi:hypothetical protein
MKRLSNEEVPYALCWGRGWGTSAHHFSPACELRSLARTYPRTPCLWHPSSEFCGWARSSCLGPVRTCLGPANPIKAPSQRSSQRTTMPDCSASQPPTPRCSRRNWQCCTEGQIRFRMSSDRNQRSARKKIGRFLTDRSIRRHFPCYQGGRTAMTVCGRARELLRSPFQVRVSRQTPGVITVGPSHSESFLP